MGQQWGTMGYDGQQLGNNRQQWAIMGQQWATMDSNGQQSTVLHASLMPFFAPERIICHKDCYECPIAQVGQGP